MGSVTVLTGPSGVRKKFECFPVASGLVAHSATDVEKKQCLLNITHKKSGLAVLQHVPEWAVPIVVTILGRMDWNIPVDKLWSSLSYFPLIEHTIREVARVSLTKKESLRQENELARDLSGRRQPASGSRWGRRRDVITPELLIEAKTTGSAKHSISDKDMTFLKKQAYMQGKIPVFAVEIQQRPNVMVVPAEDLDSECFDNKKRKSVDARHKKSYAITVEMADWLNDGGSMTIRLAGGFYTAVGYEKFLELAKRGING